MHIAIILYQLPIQALFFRVNLEIREVSFWKSFQMNEYKLKRQNKLKYMKT